MNTIEFQYQGQLRTGATHLKSGNSLTTDAPVDNHGKGETFSPTDLVATALVSCMITVMGIKAEKHGCDMGEVTGSVKKVMADNPRRIGQLNVVIEFQGHRLSGQERALMQQTALNCPVAKSLHPDITQQVQFIFD